MLRGSSLDARDCKEINDLMFHVQHFFRFGSYKAIYRYPAYVYVFECIIVYEYIFVINGFIVKRYQIVTKLLMPRMNVYIKRNKSKLSDN